MDPAEASLAAALVQLIETMSDPMDVERLERAIASPTFLERRGSFRSAWQAGLATRSRLIFLEGETQACRPLQLQLPTLTSVNLHSTIGAAAEESPTSRML